jgi:RND superfamily putative drug exporter
MSQFLFRLGRASARHPFRAIGAWVLVAFVVLSLASRIGGDYQNDFTVPGVESQAATDVLEQRFPAQADETGQVVFHVDSGLIDEPERQATVHATLERLAEGTDVSGVTDPYAPRGPTISADGRTAFAGVQYSVEEDERPSTRISTGRA